MAKPRTLFDKIWDSHVVHRQEDGTCVLYIDRHLVHEVTSPQAFEGLRLAGRKVRRPEATLAVADHNVPTGDRSEGIVVLSDTWMLSGRCRSMSDANTASSAAVG